MKKIIRITESQLDYVIKNLIIKEHRLLREGTRGMAKPIEDKYHPHWDEEDTILSWYCTKYGNHLSQAFGLGQTKENEKYEIDDYHI